MGVFDDKKFDQLDWMTQITETIESDLNTLLAKLPDRVDLGINNITECAAGGSRFSLRTDVILRELLIPFTERRNLSWQEEDRLIKCFRFEASPDLELNFETGKMTGTVALVKIVPTLTDEELQPFMGHKGIQALNSAAFDEDVPFERMNEMLDILGKCDEAQKNRSFNKKMNRIKDRLNEIFTTNEWRIRDMELANRVGTWIAQYIDTGNLAALTNLCKLKVMTHNNMPIYSIEEEK